MTLWENIYIAFRAVRANLLRAILTLLIISFGIMALVGILTAIDSAIFSLSDNLSSIGANTFDVDRKGDGAQGRGGGRRAKKGDPFSYKQATDFKERYDFPALTSVSVYCTGNAAIKYQDEKTNPNVLLFGVDENYLEGKGYEVEIGRNFTAKEALNGGYIAMVGHDIVKQLFKGKSEKALNSSISAGNIKLRIVGVLKERGSTMNQSQDRRILIPLQTGKRYYGSQRTNYNILVSVNDATRMDGAIENATMTLRNVRGLKASEENDFEISKSDELINIIRDNTVYLRAGAVGIGLITLIGAAIGLMNIMLVSVTERTHEIGISKALGATRFNVMVQFLTEAVTITLLGGALGILLGVLIGNLVTFAMGGSFLFPWAWIAIAIVLCVMVGLASGLYPALKAARLDPIEALRYE